MDEQRRLHGGGQLLGPAEGVVGAGVGRMDKDRRGDQRLAVLPALKESGRHLDVPARILRSRGGKIDDRLRRQAAQTRFGAGPRHLVFIKIAVRHRGGTAEQHLGGGQLGAPVHHLRVDRTGFGRKDMPL